MLRQGQRVIFDLDDAGPRHPAAPRLRGRHEDARPSLSGVRAFARRLPPARPLRQHLNGERAPMSGRPATSSCRQWVDHWAAHPPARRRLLVRRLGRGVRPAVRRARRQRHVHVARPGQAAEQLLGPLRSRRRGPRRGPHVHLLGRRARRRPEQQLARARRDARRDDRPLHRRDAGPHDVRRAVLDGPARLADRPHRRAAHRLGLRRGEHADHDPHGPEGARRARRRRRVRAVRALRRRPARRRARPTCRGRATRTTSTSCTSPRPARSSRTARATAATPCSARSASPCASPR